jgi:dihydrolipoamide dehydrogenase
MDSFDLVVIGSGPGGYVAAIRAAQLGLRTALVEKDAALGGTCLNVGCIPSKAMLESSELYHLARARLGEHGVKVAGDVQLDLPTMLARKERIVGELTSGVAQLMKKNKVTVLRGRGSLAAADRVKVQPSESGEGSGAKGEPSEVGARAVILATGSVPVQLPFLPFDGKRVIDSTGALALTEVPGHLVVIGAGAVGLELGSVWRRLGAKVTVVEMMPQITPFADTQMARTLQRSLKEQGLDIQLKTQVSAARVEANGVTLTLKDAKDQQSELGCDVVLVAVGRKPYHEGLGLESAGVELDPRGRVKVDAELRTSVPTIYAIGDLIEGPMLAHKASEEGVAVAERLAGQAAHVSYEAIPSVVYTAPELAQVGLTEEQVKERGLEPRIGRFLFRPNGRAKSLGEEEGTVKLIADAQTDRLLGAHIVGPRASELIGELVLALEFKASAEDVARTSHAHPTLSEVVKEAALAVAGRAIHG